ncbi:bile acid:sodium symporter family protein [Paenibacillus campi]|uniref:bile acid:sodium symporter family protein n=1 Tax=Paenibacillus campi TaxID=3106031 RepID=UPI002AFEBD96|nr:bile acid:sodium symporter [Paenibacillus sp. SGZ-1014]
MRQAMDTFTRSFEKYMFAIIPCTLLLGFAWSKPLIAYTHSVPYLFAYVTFVMGIGCGRKHVQGVLQKPLPLLLTLLMAHIVAPLLAYELGLLLFGAGSPYTVGLVLFTAIPLGVSSVLWVSMSSGNVALALALVIVDSAISPFVVPGLIELLFGASIHFDTLGMIRDLMLIIVLPTLLGMVVYELSRGTFKTWSAPVTLPLSKLCFAGVVLLNAAAIAPQLHALKGDLPVVIPAVLITVALCYGLGYVCSGILRAKGRELPVTLAYTSGMRNISVGIVIAMGYFSPQTAVPVVLGIMLQQPMATLQYSIFQRIAAYRKAQRLKQANYIKGD